MPSAIRPAWVFVPDPLIVEIESSRFGPLCHEAAGEPDLCAGARTSAADIVVFESALHRLLTAS